MIPRGKLDIGWMDLAWAAARTFLPVERRRLQRELEEAWAPGGRGVAVLSVRSGFDRILEVLRLPRGSEVLMSAVTIADMARVAEAHGLRVVPVDMDMDRLEVRRAALERAWSPRARLLVVAHLFGSRMPLDGVAEWAGERGLLLLEDAAQAYTGDGYRGHPEVDVALFSFGPIKTCTALGGGLLRFRDAELARKVREAQEALPLQSRRRFRARVAKFAVVKALLLRPVYTMFAALCRAAGRDHDRVLGESLRGFAGGELLPGIRHRPPAPLLALLRRRIGTDIRPRVEHRKAAAASVLACTPQLPRPGVHASDHGHWVVPVQVREPEATASDLRQAGIDATRGASSLDALPAPLGRDETRPVDAARVMAQVLYLPCYPGMPPLPRDLLARLRPPQPPPEDTRQPAESPDLREVRP